MPTAKRWWRKANWKKISSHKISLDGVPDVIFFNAALKHLYVAVGEPGIVDVLDSDTLKRIHVAVTEPGAHTLAFDASRNKVYAFLPNTHRAMIFVDA